MNVLEIIQLKLLSTEIKIFVRFRRTNVLQINIANCIKSRLESAYSFFQCIYKFRCIFKFL